MLLLLQVSPWRVQTRMDDVSEEPWLWPFHPIHLLEQRTGIFAAARVADCFYRPVQKVHTANAKYPNSTSALRFLEVVSGLGSLRRSWWGLSNH